MDWNPIEVTQKLWPMNYWFRALLVLEWTVIGTLLLFVLLAGAQSLSKSINPEATVPVLTTLVKWRFFGWATFTLILLVVGIGLPMAFISATTVQPSSKQSASAAKQPDSTVSCCLQDNAYQVWVYNKGNAIDTVITTLKINGWITDIRPVMGSPPPTIIQGGERANFIIFRTDDVLPDMSVTYVIDATPGVTNPAEFTAWSEVTTDNISTRFLGRCPTATVGPLMPVPQNTK